MGKPATGRQLNPAWLALGGGLLGMLAFLFLFGVAPLDAANDAFCRGGYIEKDIQQHYAGWLFYRQSAAGFPLCIAQNINYPAGLSISYTDSIPLLAAVCKLFSPVLPATFQYFGWFTLFCFIAQGAAGALLLSLFLGGPLPVLLGDLVLIASPVLGERAFRHTSLGAQFLLLGVLYYYFRSRRDERFAYKGLFVLNALAIGIHPYFLPMTYAVTLALLAEYALRNHRYGRPAAYLAANLAATLAVGGCLGLFRGRADGGSDALYGYFSLNLNALWNPVGVGGVVWSRLLPAQNQVGGNYDGFAYLGLGVLLALALLAVWMLLFARRTLWRQIAVHPVLAAVCLILTAFAITNVVTANGATLLRLPLPTSLQTLFSAFRSSGRLFWPVYLLLTLAALAGTARLAARRGGQPLAAAALALLAVVQLWDVSPGLLQRRAAMRSAEQQQAFPSAMTSSFWQQAAGRYKHLLSVDGLQNDALHLALYAADLGMTTNDPFAARYDTASLQRGQAEALAELQSGTLRADTLYLFRDEGIFLQAVDTVAGQAWCGHIYAQTADGGARTDGWYGIAPGMQNYAGDALTVPYNAQYPLRMADYTDAVWNRGVLDSDKKTICFRDSPFVRQKLTDAVSLTAAGQTYAIEKVDDRDAGWLMVTLAIDDATVLWNQELETNK